jgi:NAD(P)-dependent dehydrogenase (short-subunit alcohol dehydrogenase family)
MRDPEQVTAMVRAAAARGGRLDYVVSNAAINPLMKWDETTVEDFNNLFETNVRGTWVVCTEGAKQMIREGHGGAICCVSSISAHVGAPGQTAYCGTKGAISMLAKALGRDLGEHGADHPARSRPSRPGRPHPFRRLTVAVENLNSTPGGVDGQGPAGLRAVGRRALGAGGLSRRASRGGARRAGAGRPRPPAPARR